MSLVRVSRNIFANLRVPARSISTAQSLRVKKIDSKTENEVRTFEGVTVESPRANDMLNEACSDKFCPSCTLGLNIKHTDILILNQYLRSDGCMLPRRVTGLCEVQQKRIGSLVTMAQKAGLMPNINPSWSKRDPAKRHAWKKYNKYYDESTLD